MHDVVVIGSGAAGMSAALAAAETGTDVAIVTDRGLGTANSALAQGGVQYPEGDQASLDRFADDIRISAETTVDEELLQRFTAEVRPVVDDLVVAGLELDRDDEGRLVKRLAGGMSEPRVVTAGDRIGGPVLRVLRSRLGAVDVESVTKTLVVDIVTDRRGLRLVTEGGADLVARAVVVATGGTSFRHARSIGHQSSNPSNRNHVLTDVIRRLGLAEIDGLLYQWQPFGLVGSAGGPAGHGHLVPESIVELGVALRDGAGREIVDPMAGRRRVAQAIFDAIERGRGVETPDGVGVRLTLGDVDRRSLVARYPTLVRRLGGEDEIGDVVVVPFVHYQLGGFAVQPDCSTAVDGLYLAGEITGGLHGRNRLMGNGLTDSLVHGRRAGAEAAAFIRRGSP